METLDITLAPAGAGQDTTVQISNSEFMEAIFGNSPDEIHWATHFPGNPKTNAKWGGQVVKGTNVRDYPNENSYYSIASFKSETGGRKKDNFKALHTVVLDDLRGAETLPSSYLLETSRPEGIPNYQAGFILAEPITDLGIAARLQEELASAGHLPNDKNGNNPVRWVRLPVGCNGKHNPSHPCQLHEWRPDRRYRLDEIIDGLGLDRGYILKGRNIPVLVPLVPTNISGASGASIPEGSRNSTLTSLAGSMRRNGMVEAAIAAALQAENEARCVPPLDPAEVSQIAASIAKYDPAPAVSADDIVALENQNHFVTKEGGKAIVVCEEIDPETGQDKLDFLTFQDYRQLNSNRFIDVQKATAKGTQTVSKLFPDYWLMSPNRRQYPKGMAMLPNQQAPAGVYNLWGGFGVEPHPGDPGPALRHLYYVLCNGDHVLFLYILGWIARAIQHPELQAETAIVMRGDQGTGKGTLGRWMVQIFGIHGKHITQPRHLVGNFNAHLRRALFLFADEALFVGDRAGVEVLKGLITEPTVQIEKKGVDVFTATNRLKIMMATNHDWAIPAGPDERRYVVSDVSNCRRQNHGYFAKLNAHMTNGGLAAFLDYLLTYDLSNFNVRDIPQTQGLLDQKLFSLSPLNEWIFESLCRGHLPFLPNWQQQVTRDSVVSAFAEWVRQRGDRFTHTSSDAVGKGLRKAIGAKDGPQITQYSRRHRTWDLPPLIDARKEFEKNILGGASYNWP